MLPVALGATHGPLRVLCLGAHADDVEIGCGGTLLRLLAERPGSEVRVVVFSADERREAEARASAAAFLADAARADVVVHRFRESYFPDAWAEIKAAVEEVRAGGDADLVLTHRRDDEHQDHRTIGELTWNSFRDHLVLEYEIPKYEGDLGRPNVFVPLSREVADRKVTLLLEHFRSQQAKPWFRAETFQGLMAVRAVECGSPCPAAEAFHARKLVVTGGGRP